MPMENPFTAYGKGPVFPTCPQTGFPQQRLGRQFTHIPTTPTATIIHPILSDPCPWREGDRIGFDIFVLDIYLFTYISI